MAHCSIKFGRGLSPKSHIWEWIRITLIVPFCVLETSGTRRKLSLVTGMRRAFTLERLKSRKNQQVSRRFRIWIGGCHILVSVS
ncbi:hypothetical protein PAXRUDRAFT_255644 [Paxillus rubicundulus Ve08.2h10]|uniref:Uncharacterized protein n=1 Tax=Paxillus rubicundulus Ve08.2h10 TaxID=930991 RepID=A0A0D0CWT1_9AGAM|nr:hypothetical protein PAXRUDRAFT_255644 [Paxillus rubicundulus Ve08.2h10]